MIEMSLEAVVIVALVSMIFGMMLAMTLSRARQ